MRTPTERLQEQYGPREFAVLRETAERNGWEWVEEHAQLCLDQARLVGDLTDED